jgi:hypothetical protein
MIRAVFAAAAVLSAAATWAQSPVPSAAPAAPAPPAASPAPAPPAPAYSPAPPDARRGKELLDAAVAAHGGAAAIDAVERVEIRGTSGRTLPGQPPIEMPSLTQFVIPDQYRHQLTTQAGPISTLLNKDGAFVILASGALPLPPAEAAALRSTSRRSLFALLKSRKAEDFRVARVGTGRAGDTALEMVEVEFSGDKTVLGIDPATGLVRQAVYTMPIGQATAQVVATFSDYRALANGFKYPFRSAGLANGQPAFTTRIESVTLNGAIDPALFVPPVAPVDMPSFELPPSPGPVPAPMAPSPAPSPRT